jgi:phage gpG-like protein
MPPSNVRIIDRGLLGIIAESKMFQRSYTKVGLPAEGPLGEPSDTTTGTPRKTVADNVMVGAVHEFGAPKRNIPERSWLRSAFDKEQGRIKELMALSYDRVLQGRSTARRELAAIGEWFVARVKANFPPEGAPGLSGATIAAKLKKGETQPTLLVETGQLRNSVTHAEVIRG